MQSERLRPLRRNLHWFGGLLAVTAIVFVAFRLREYWQQTEEFKFGFDAWALTLVLAAVYAGANLVLARAWAELLGHFDSLPSRRQVVRIYAISQIGKYIPGNIFHLAGRQALGMAAGIPGWVLIKTTFWELALLSAAGAMIAVLALPLLLTSMSVSVVGALSLLMLSALIAISIAMPGRELRRALWLYLAFLAIAALCFVLLLAWFCDCGLTTPWLWLAVMGAYVAAWLIGMLTPGAPAGFGIREVVLLFLLASVVAEGELLIAVLAGRVVTLVGDVLFYLFRPSAQQ